MIVANCKEKKFSSGSGFNSSPALCAGNLPTKPPDEILDQTLLTDGTSTSLDLEEEWNKRKHYSLVQEFV